MKELTFEQMDNVSGAYSWGSIGDIFGNVGEAAMSATLAFSLGSVFGALVGGTYGGVGGGMLGFGIISQGVGALAGAIWGGGLLAVAAVVVGWDVTYDYCQKGMDAYFDGTWKPVPEQI